MIQIIHISDFHLDSKPISYQKECLVKALIEDLKKQSINFQECIFVISGDLIDKGGAGFSSLSEAFEYFKEIFVDKILNDLNLSYEQFFFVPGNHDINRNKINEIIENGIVQKVSTREGVNDFINSNKNKSILLDRIFEYKSFETSFYNELSIDKQLSNFDSCFITKNNVGVACLNSSWRSSSNDDKNLIIGEKQIESAIQFFENKENLMVKIAIMHHSINDLQNDDIATIKSKLFSHFDILLVGHKHYVDIDYTRTFSGTLLISQSNASLADFSDSKYQNGYSIIHFDKGTNARIVFRKYLTDKEIFVSNTDVGNDKGEIIINYPSQQVIEEDVIMNKIIDNLRDVQLENLNEHLFTYGIDEKIPCRLEDVFVEPMITNLPDTHSDSDNIVYYHISDLLYETNNFLIYGVKESGKSTLIDKILLEYVVNFEKLRKIPVIIKFSDLGTQRLDQIIRKFLNISSSEYRSLAPYDHIVLLIDDIAFDNSNNLKEISEFVRNYPQVRIISAKEQMIENVLPQDFLDYNSEFNFHVAYIQNFKTKQIKQLVQKWFPTKTEDYKTRINRLIKNFEALSLPRTPLAVTLFLWIVDKQEKTPINNSILVQQVVENLLEKAHFENIYQDKFSYQNKIRLLAFIAKRMNDEGDEEKSYRLPVSSILQYIDDYADGKYTLNSQKVIDDFIRRGILSYNDENFVKYKFDFLYRYFFALYFEYDDNYRKNIFWSDSCLDYLDEIIYYSGLHTDCVDLLGISQKILTTVFSDFNSDISSNPQKLDLFFNTTDLISQKLNFDNIKKKPSEQELDKIYDEELSSIPIKKSIEKRKKTSNKPFDLSLKFAALLFKNLEEVDNVELRLEALKNIQISSISFLLLYRDAIIHYYINNQKAPEGFPKNINFGMFVKLLPLLHQSLMSDWLGTEKTKLIFEKKIKNHKLELSITEYEKFLDIFIFADIRGKDSPIIVKEFLKNSKYKYIKDLGVMKLILYYYMRSKTKESDEFYLNLISDLKLKLKQISDKTKCITELKDGRNKESREDIKS